MNISSITFHYGEHLVIKFLATMHRILILSESTHCVLPRDILLIIDSFEDFETLELCSKIYSRYIRYDESIHIENDLIVFLNTIGEKPVTITGEQYNKDDYHYYDCKETIDETDETNDSS
jgi:hypothetical protein